MKKALSIVLALLLTMVSLVTPAFAASSETYVSEDGTLIIKVNSEAKYQQVVAEIEAANARAEQLWQKALQESQLPENQVDFSQFMKAPGQLKTISVTTIDSPSALRFAQITFSTTYIEGTDAYNHALFSQIRNVDAYGTTSSTQVTINDVDYTIIDSGRTLSTSYSLRVGIEVSDGDIRYYTKDFYVEFYSMSGSGKVYK